MFTAMSDGNIQRHWYRAWRYYYVKGVININSQIIFDDGVRWGFFEHWDFFLVDQLVMFVILYWALLVLLLLAFPLSWYLGFRTKQRGVRLILPAKVQLLFIMILLVSFAFLQFTNRIYSPDAYVTYDGEGQHQVSFLLRNKSFMPVRLDLLLFDVVGEYHISELWVAGERFAGHRLGPRQAEKVIMKVKFAAPIEEALLNISYITIIGQHKVLRVPIRLKVR
ncbi:MAG: hypothetical protein KGZ92_04080 [Firmicutes bacterium]|nr:hypothetical protein [Dethiobacter sp.]MBS3888466.1 hypothetical protein [Bacillota bacterium]